MFLNLIGNGFYAATRRALGTGEFHRIHDQTAAQRFRLWGGAHEHQRDCRVAALLAMTLQCSSLRAKRSNLVGDDGNMSVGILVVDDEPDMAEMFRQRFGREARTASS